MTAPNSVSRLVLVYNADSGFLSAMADSARKLLGVGGCVLCSLTHGMAGERREWRECREALDVPVDSVHRDELGGELAAVVGSRIPSVVAETPEGFVILLEPRELKAIESSPERLQELLLAAAEETGLLLLESS